MQILYHQQRAHSCDRSHNALILHLLGFPAQVRRQRPYTHISLDKRPGMTEFKEILKNINKKNHKSFINGFDLPEF